MQGKESWTYLADTGGSSQFDGSYSAASYSGVIFSSASMLLGTCRQTDRQAITS